MFKLINKLKNRKGFTLIELIVVLAVLAIIMAIAVPRFIGVRDDAAEKADESTLKMIAKAAELYYVQENKTGTPTTNLGDISSYFDDDDVDFKSSTYKSLNTSPSSINIEFNSDGSVDKVGSISIDTLN